MAWEASKRGSPSMARCSQVTWLRSSLLRTSDDRARVGPGLVVLGRGQHLGHAAHLHGPVADHGHRLPGRGRRTWPPSHRARRGPWWPGSPTAIAFMPRRMRDVAGVPVRRRARVRRQDRVVGQVSGQRREQMPWGRMRPFRSDGWPRSSMRCHHSFTCPSILSCHERSDLWCNRGISSARVSLASPTRARSIG